MRIAGTIRRWFLPLIGLPLLVIGIAAAWQWQASERFSIHSTALGQPRIYRVFNPDSDGAVIYSLDGQAIRNSLFPAVIFSLSAVIRGRALPRIVAIHSHPDRNRDFRPASSTPSYWRPAITGRSDDFDRFLLGELQPHIETRETQNSRRYLLGHSLSGLYALDLAARRPGHFSGVFAFAPTFSHDVSIEGRLARTCNSGTIIFANWGLESARETELFDTATEQWKSSRNCRSIPPVTPRHYGSPHPSIMLTGQIHAAFLMAD